MAGISPPLSDPIFYSHRWGWNLLFRTVFACIIFLLFVWIAIDSAASFERRRNVKWRWKLPRWLFRHQSTRISVVSFLFFLEPLFWSHLSCLDFNGGSLPSIEFYLDLVALRNDRDVTYEYVRHALFNGNISSGRARVTSTITTVLHVACDIDLVAVLFVVQNCVSLLECRLILIGRGNWCWFLWSLLRVRYYSVVGRAYHWLAV